MSLAKPSFIPLALVTTALLVGGAKDANADVTFSCKPNSKGACNIVAIDPCTCGGKT